MATLSGKWQWNSSPSGSSSTGYTREEVSFTSNGSSYSSVMIVPTGVGSNISILYDDSEVFNTASGWTSSAYRTMDFGSGVSVGSSFYNYLTSNASQVVTKYNVTYYVRMQNADGSYGSAEYVTTQSYEAGDTITPPSVQTIVGYGAPDWRDLPSTMPASNLTIYGYRDIAKFTVTFIVDGSTVKSSSLAYGATIAYPSDPDKDGYTFKGWSPSPSTMPAEDITITAVFEENPKYTVSYYTCKEYNNNGVIATTKPELVEVQTYEEGDTISPPSYPSEQGYTPTGWVY